MKHTTMILMAMLSMVVLLLNCSSRQADNNIVVEDSVAVDSVVVVEPTEYSIMMMGDMVPATLYPFTSERGHLPVKDGATLFDSVAPLLHRADFAVGNMEGTLIDRSPDNDKAVNSFSAFVFMIPTRYAQRFKDAGFSALAVINNHANDLTTPGIKSTRATLRSIGLPYSGFSQDGGYTIVEKEGVKYALCAFGTSPNGYHIDDIDNACKIVAEADSVADIVVVSFHGGNEGSAARHVPRKREVFNNGLSRGDVYKFAHACVDVGADVVFGHGPHVCRGMELYNDRVIAYSLGNFCTPVRMKITGINGYAPLLEVRVDGEGRFVGGKIHSFIQRRGDGPIPDTTYAAACDIRALSIADFPESSLAISEEGVLTETE